MLESISTRVDDKLKNSLKKENKELIEKIGDYQKMFRAAEKHSLLIVLQGMDAAGKDGAVRTIFEEVNPIGTAVTSWKKPTEEEYGHDFLWRIHKKAPRKGMIRVFNRSHYEDILVPAVNGYLPEEEIEKRYDHINNFERLLQDNGTTILKFYLHISKEEQHERLMERVNIPHKYYKHSDGDWETREQWDDYMAVYEKIFERCNEVPWTIVPSDQNWNKVNVISEAIYQAFEAMNLQWPGLESERFGNKKV